METRSVDVAVIGAGTAGLNAHNQVVKAGRTAVLIESGPYGTTCARVGCMPSKLLIAAAEAAHALTQADTFGIQIVDGWRIDGRAVMARVRALRDDFVGGVIKGVESIPEGDRIRGQARFTGQTTLEVDDHTRIEAGAVVIAAGSTPWVPPPFDGLSGQVITSDDIFELETLPESVAVVGTGVIALELGQALARLGVRVSFFNPFDDFGPFTDPDVNRTAREVLCAELDVNLKVEILEARAEADSVTIRWRDPEGGTHESCYEYVLAAAGRRPNIAALDLEKTGLPLDDKGMPPWDRRTTRCGDAPIFLAGDVNGHRPILHEASDEGRIAGENAAHFPDLVADDRRTFLTVAFTDPEMAIVGTSYADLNHERSDFGEVSMARQGRARVMAQNRGLIRIYADCASCTLLGAEMFGPRVENMAHLLAWAVQQGMTVQQALRMPFYHPVLEEGLRTALINLVKKLGKEGECRCQDLSEAPGQ